MAEGILTFVGAVIVVGLLGDGSLMGAEANDQAAPLFVIAYILIHEVVGRRMLATAHRLRAEGAKRFSTRMTMLTQLVGLASICIAGWGLWIAARLGVESPVIRDFLTLVPWLLVHTRWLMVRRRVEAVMGARDWPAGSYLAFHLRLLIVPATPYLALSALEGWVASRPETQRFFEAFPTAVFALTMAFAFVIFSSAPFLVRLALGTRTMPDGPLRRRFERLSQRAGFRYLDIRVCDTHGNVANAAFVGLLGRLRYVIMTDALLERLDDDDLVGVFAHEMGHSMKRHLAQYVLLFLGFAAILQLITLRVVDPAAGVEAGGGMSLFLPLLAFPIFIFLVFSPTARSFEIEADVYAGEILRDASPIARSLSKLGFSDPEKRRREGLIHPSIETRVSFLERYFSDPEVAKGFSRRMRSVRRGVILFGVVPIILLVFLLPLEIRSGRLNLAIDRAVREEDEAAARDVLGDIERRLAAGELQDDGYAIRMPLWQTLATARQDAGDLESAVDWVERMTSVRDEASGLLPPYNIAIISAQQEAAGGNWPAFVRELARAERALPAIITGYGLPDDDEQVVRERALLVFLRRAANLLAESGAMPLLRRTDVTGTLEATPEGTVLSALEEGYRQGKLPPLPADGEGDDGPAGWRAAFFRRLRDTLERRLAVGPSKVPPSEH